MYTAVTMGGRDHLHYLFGVIFGLTGTNTAGGGGEPGEVPRGPLHSSQPDKVKEVMTVPAPPKE